MEIRQANHRGETETVALSSIALLQERFRQLQRMKELRQEKDLLKKLSQYDRPYNLPIMHRSDPNPKTVLGSEFIFLPPKPHCQLSLSLWPDSHINSPGRDHPTSSSSSSSLAAAKSWFSDAPHMVYGSSIKLENSDCCDIDTSLHL